MAATRPNHRASLPTLPPSADPPAAIAPNAPRAAIYRPGEGRTNHSATPSPSETGSHSANCGACSRSEEHTSELQSLMRNSYAVFCLKKKKQQNNTRQHTTTAITMPHSYIQKTDHNQESIDISIPTPI